MRLGANEEIMAANSESGIPVIVGATKPVFTSTDSTKALATFTATVRSSNSQRYLATIPTGSKNNVARFGSDAKKDLIRADLTVVADFSLGGSSDAPSVCAQGLSVVD